MDEEREHRWHKHETTGACESLGEGRRGRRMEGWLEGWMEGWMDGWLPVRAVERTRHEQHSDK